AQSNAGSILSRRLPKRSLTGRASQPFRPYTPFTDCCTTHADAYSIGAVLTFPLFTGFKDSSDRLQAQEQAKAAQADAETLEQQVILQVWTSYQGVKSARK